MINLTDLAINFGNKSLFENSSLTFDPGKCYGIVGANGTGKSTLLRLISGDEKPVSGTISVPAKINIGVLSQNHFQFENISVIEVVLLGKPKLCNAIREKENIGTFTPTKSRPKLSLLVSCLTPSIRFVASAAKFWPMTFETNGKLRDARKLHSMTLTEWCLARNCMLNGPVIFNALAIEAAICLIRRIVEM